RSKRWANTKTSVTRSPPPPANGALWQPEQAFESGEESRSKFLGNTNGDVGSEIGVPVPFVRGRPAPSLTVNLAVKSCMPYWINWSNGVLNSSPSWRCLGIAVSCPIWEPDCLLNAATANKSNKETASHSHAVRKHLVITSSFLRDC